MKKPKATQTYPYIIVGIAAVVMYFMLNTSDGPSFSFPALLFMSATMSVFYGVLEIAFVLLNRYDEKEDVYKAISRAISAFGMTVCFMVLVGAYEASKR